MSKSPLNHPIFFQQSIRKGVFSLLFYVLYGVFAFFVLKYSPKGLCAPGIGTLPIFFFPLVVIGLLFRSLFKLIKGKPEYMVSFGLHLIVVLILSIGLFILIE